MRQDIQKKLDQLQEEIEAVNDALDILTEAKLRNESISEKAKAVMQGNRTTYIKFVRMFLDALDIPEEISQESVQGLIAAFEEKLDTMHKSTAKSFYILQEFFAHESAEVARRLKTVDTTMRSLLDNDFSRTLAVERRIKAMDTLHQNREDMMKRIAELKQEEMMTASSIQDTETQTRKLKHGPAWLELDRLLKEQEALAQKLKREENHLHGMIAPLDRVMRKYAWLVPEHKGLAERYLGSPMATLLEDTRLEIIALAQRAAQLVQDGQIELKDKEKEKTLQRLQEFREDALQDILAQHHAGKDMMDELGRRVRGNGAMRELEGLEYKLNHLREKHARLLESKGKLEKQYAKMDVEKEKEALQAEIGDVLGVRVTIT